MGEKMTIKQKTIRIIIIFIFIFNLLTFEFYFKEDFDKSTAEEILKEAYLPLINFVKTGTSVEGEDLLLLPRNIKNKKDFAESFNEKAGYAVAEGFFDEMIVEKNGVLYIDKTVYIPNIHSSESELVRSYTEKRLSLYSYIMGYKDITEEQLVIKEKLKISGKWDKRSNYFVQKENGKWQLDYFDGIGMHGFVDSSDNPWSSYFQQN